MPTIFHDTPFGRLAMTDEGGALVATSWLAAGEPAPTGRQGDTALLARARRALDRYAGGDLAALEDPAITLAPAGTDFRRRVWGLMRQIKAGQMRSYADLARGLGSGPRAVGGACGKNPIPVFIPCHRVVASGGKLGGYSGGQGLATKAALLRHEGARPLP